MKSTKKTTAVAVLSPAVTSSVNINISQNDVVEMAVNESLERLEDEISNLFKVAESFSANRIKFEKSLIKKAIDNCPRQFVNIAVSLGCNQASIQCSLSYGTKNYVYINHPTKEAFENGTSARTSTHVATGYTLNGVEFSIEKEFNSSRSYRKHGSYSVAINYPWQDLLGKSDVEEFEKAEKELESVYLLITEKVDQYRKLKRSGSRLKSKMVRTALAGSEEGRKVLNLIDSKMKSIKLLA